jgi:DNA-binding MarR family transcriptional regulator
MHLLYLRFKGLANAIQKNKHVDLDPIALQILEIISEAHTQDLPMRVSDVLSLTELASYATLHKKLESLKLQGYVEVEMHEGDHRSRYIVPSKLAIKLFDALGKAVLQASHIKA